MTIEEPKPPRPTGKVLDVVLDGLLIAYHQKRLVLLDVPGSEFRYLPLFPNAESLKKILTAAKASWDAIKKVTDQYQFMESLPGDIKIAVNPRHMPDGKVRWAEIVQQ